ncbi:hypothetical protein KPH14_011646 [Odynerus spinipes]|uniref:Uncharacterized protein n=1 Tax=Odynerus spinipes TaxID=1348599 RepID=A0AAD9VL24_9HYME|nr:hypothetical protein KPH14_011646 [Odynerus spinipes]
MGHGNEVTLVWNDADGTLARTREWVACFHAIHHNNSHTLVSLIYVLSKTNGVTVRDDPSEKKDETSHRELVGRTSMMMVVAGGGGGGGGAAAADAALVVVVVAVDDGVAV